MLKRMTGDIFTSRAEALVNPVNCVGVMGKGLALEFKKRFHNNFVYYKSTCDAGGMTPGVPSCWRERDDLWIINMPTKNHWRQASRIEWIESGLENLAGTLKFHNIKSIAMPMLGCGLGGLDERNVLPLIERFSDKLPHVEVELWSKE